MWVLRCTLSTQFFLFGVPLGETRCQELQAWALCTGLYRNTLADPQADTRPVTPADPTPPTRL